MDWLIYGASGYTAQLIAKEAVRRGQRPILAGRNLETFSALAKELDLPTREFDLESPASVKKGLEGIGICLHCAGPFTHTAEVMRSVAIDLGCHYLDITGEYQVLEDSYQTHQLAREKGAVVISGVGFDVVATDTLAAMLKREMPDATHLELAFADSAGPSAGTAKTALEMLPQGLIIREAGALKQVKPGSVEADIPFADKKRHCVAISWGDVVTAYHSTGIENINVYIPMPAKKVAMMKRWHWMAGAIRWTPLRRFLQNLIEKKVHGPSDEALKTRRTQLWGRVSNGEKQIEKCMDVPQGYQYTVLSALYAVEQLLAHKVMPGAYTPSQAFDLEALQVLDHIPPQTLAIEEE